MLPLRIGDYAPNFHALTTQGVIEFHEWIEDSWTLFFSHPGDYTPVCTTEVGRVSILEDEFEKRNVKALGLSRDSVDSHLAWIDDINESQKTDFFVPLIDDASGAIGQQYGMYCSNENRQLPGRQLYIIDSDKTVRFSMTYPINVGRNFCEVLRVIDALQVTLDGHTVTPADWKSGEPAIISPAVSDKKAAVLFPQGWKTVLPYLREVEI